MVRDDAWNVIAQSVGCPNATAGAESVECMRSQPADKLEDGVGLLGPAGGPSSILAFWPVVDGKTVFPDAWDREKKGQFIKRVRTLFCYEA